MCESSGLLAFIRLPVAAFFFAGVGHLLTSSSSPSRIALQIINSCHAALFALLLIQIYLILTLFFYFRFCSPHFSNYQFLILTWILPLWVVSSSSFIVLIHLTSSRLPCSVAWWIMFFIIWIFLFQFSISNIYLWFSLTLVLFLLISQLFFTDFNDPLTSSF